MRNVFMESGFISLNKVGEQLCGDHIVTLNNDEFSTIVLSDGLGSGVKANILSTLTSTIIATMMDNSMPIEECVATIASTLPVCSVRQVAYSTFTILQVSKKGDAYLVQFDNPQAILLRNGKNFNYPSTQKIICGKNIYESNIKIITDDMFILMSDGAIHAGVGTLLNFGWERNNIVEFAETHYTPDISAKTMAATIGTACRDLYGGMPGDDTTIAALKIREHRTVNLMIGPPSDAGEDSRILDLFFSREGKHIVCGGTTSQLVSKYLNTPIETALDYKDSSIPPIAHIKGVDLVTEGVITIGRVLELAEEYFSVSDFSTKWKGKTDGASLICEMLFEEATDIHFFVGRAINPAHQNPDLPIHINIKMQLIEDLTSLLKTMGKKVTVNVY